MNVKQPTALVTGGSRGIGASICRSLAADGYKVLVNYRESQELADSLAEEISGYSICADLSDDEQICEMFSYVSSNFGALSLLVNNAGIAECESLKTITKESFFRTIQVNLWAQLLCTKLAVRSMEAGSIVFISSTCAQRPTPDALAYAASKSGLEAIVRSIAAELAPSIRVNAVAPSTTRTDMMRQNFTDKDLKWIEQNYPMGGPCEPEEIAQMVSYLASNRARSITGQVFVVDGGLSVV